MQPFLKSSNGPAIKDILHWVFMMNLVCVELCKYANGRPEEASCVMVTEAVMQGFEMAICHPLSQESLEVLQALSRINVRDTMRLLFLHARMSWKDCERFDIPLPSETYTQITTSSIIQIIITNHSAHQEVLQLALAEKMGDHWERLRTGHHFDELAVSFTIPSYQDQIDKCVALIASILEEESLEEEVFEEYHPDDLTDAGFEPYGRAIYPEDYPEPFRPFLKRKRDFLTFEDEDPIPCGICLGDLGAFNVVKLDVCNHTFHRNCLRELINGISTFSNKCPECREQICQPKAKKAILTEVAHEAVAEEEDFEVEVTDVGGIEEEFVVEDILVEVLGEVEAVQRERRRGGNERRDTKELNVRMRQEKQYRYKRISKVRAESETVR